MSAPENSCDRWFRKSFVPTPCAKCSTPTKGKCIDYKVTAPPEGVVEPQANIIQAVIEPDGPVRQQINIHAECSKPRPLLESDKDKLRCCTMCVAQEQNISPNLCSAACRPLKTYLHLEEWTKRPLPKPTYKNAVVLDPTTIAGRCFPCKFRLKRLKNKCLDCGRDLYFRYPITNNSDLLLLQNCCDVEVYPMKKVENMNNVKVTKISGEKKFANSLLKERSECRLHNLAYYLALAQKQAPPVKKVDLGAIDRKSRKSSRKSRKSTRKSRKSKKG